MRLMVNVVEGFTLASGRASRFARSRLTYNQRASRDRAPGELGDGDGGRFRSLEFNEAKTLRSARLAVDNNSNESNRACDFEKCFKAILGH